MTPLQTLLQRQENIEKAYPVAYKWAKRFHELYEENAPKWGYETKKETRVFDSTSNNGRLMANVCFEIYTEIRHELLQEVVKVIEGNRREIVKTPYFRTPITDAQDEEYNQALSDLKSLLDIEKE